MTFPALIVVPTKNVESAKTIYQALLGIEPYVDSPYYVGFKTETGEIGIDPNGHEAGPLPYWDVENLESSIETLKAAGATIKQEPTEVGGGLTIAVLEDSDGNQIGLRFSAGG